MFCELGQQTTLANATVTHDDVLEQDIVVELLLFGCHGACVPVFSACVCLCL